MWKAVLFILPIQVASQSVCVPFSDSTQTVVHSDTRPFFISKDEFEMTLVSSARSKLARTINGVTVHQELAVTQSGSRTVTTDAYINTTQATAAQFTKECYTITYDGRRGTIILRADYDTKQPIPTIPPTHRPAVRTKEYMGLTKQQWWSMTPYFVMYTMFLFI